MMSQSVYKKEQDNIGEQFIHDIRDLIESCRANVAQTVNTSLVLLNWNIGKRIRNEILQSKRAEYGGQIIDQLAKYLTAHYGRGFTRTALNRMVHFYEQFSDIKIVATLSHQLSWSHFVEVIALSDDLQRQFYSEMCRVERWSVRDLREKIRGMFYERTAISKQPKEVIKQELTKLRDENKLTPDFIFRDPYTLDFLGLEGGYSEKSFESAILKSMEKFLLELGSDFTFQARQKRITVDRQDYYMDLVFFHRKLKSMIVLELKLGRFKAAYKGQMELYLRWLEKYEINEGENPPIGIILCSEKSEEHIELLQLEKSGIRVARYLTELPPKEIFHEQLKKAISLAQEKHDQLADDDEAA